MTARPSDLQTQLTSSHYQDGKGFYEHPSSSSASAAGLFSGGTSSFRGGTSSSPSSTAASSPSTTPNLRPQAAAGVVNNNHRVDHFLAYDDDIGSVGAAMGGAGSSSDRGIGALLSRWLWGSSSPTPFSLDRSASSSSSSRTGLSAAFDYGADKNQRPTVHIPANSLVSAEELTFAEALRRQTKSSSQMHGGLLGALGGESVGHLVTIGTYGHGYGHGGFGGYGPAGRYYGAGDLYSVVRGGNNGRNNTDNVTVYPTIPPSPATAALAASSAAAAGLSHPSANASPFLDRVSRSPSTCAMKMDVFDKCVHMNGGHDEECLFEWKEYATCQETMPGSVI